MAKRGERRRNRLRLTVAEVTAAPDSAPASEFPLLWAAPAAGLAAMAPVWLLTTGLVIGPWGTGMAVSTASRWAQRARCCNRRTCCGRRP